MLYRLLRNNKESGPFTASQLKEMGLKPYDLLWTEGKGAAWQYASEIPELKDFAPVVEEQPFDRFYKRKEALETAQQPAVAAKKVKPRFRISNGQLIMVEPGNMEVATNGAIQKAAAVRLPKETPVVEEKIAATPDWKEMYSEWQQPLKKSSKTEEPVEVETKYSESLDNLKKRYEEKVLNEKKPNLSSLSSPFSKQNIMAAVALLVLAVGGYIGYTLKQKEASVKTEGKQIVERADISGDNPLASQPTGETTTGNSSKAGNTVAPQQSSLDKSNEQVNTMKPVAETVVNAIADNKSEKERAVNFAQKKEENPVTKANIPVNKTADKNAAANDKKKEPEKTAGSTMAASKPAAQPTTEVAKATTPVATPAPVDTKPVAKQSEPKKIDDYVSLKRLGGWSGSIQNVRLVVNNVSDFPIDLAVINVQYFDNKGKYQKGETLYVRNIDGGNNVEVRVPDSEKSYTIKYKVSMVSSDQKTLYLVAD